MSIQQYIHGVDPAEQDRLAKLNALTNAPFIEFLALCNEQRVLEIGSGLGVLASQVADAISAGEMVAMEYSSDQLSQALPLCRGRANLSFVRGDAHELPFADNQFDVVYCRYVLEHLRYPHAAVAQMHRVLKQGGRLYVQENDTYLTVFDPDCPSADAVVLQFITLQAKLGGDGRLGKRLFGLLKRVGFNDVTVSLQPELHTSGMPSFIVWVENIISIITGSAAGLIENGLSTRAEIDAATDELHRLMERDDASALFHWNRACGIK